MSTGNPTPEAPLTTAEICHRARLSNVAGSLLEAEDTARTFLDRLVARGLYPDAIRFLSCCVSREDAIWWGCLCVWRACRPGPPPRVSAALRAAVRWLQEPSEDHRRAAEKAGDAAGKTTTAPGALALAAFWSQGSMGPPGLPEVLPPPTLTANTIAEAVLMAASQVPPQDVPGRQQQFIQLGLEVALGRVGKP